MEELRWKAKPGRDRGLQKGKVQFMYLQCQQQLTPLHRLWNEVANGQPKVQGGSRATLG